MERKRDLLYVSNNGELRSREFRYNNETQEAFADKKYDFRSLKYDSTGEKFYFNNVTKDGYVINGKVIDKIKKQSAKGNRLDFNSETKIYKIKDNAVLKVKIIELKAVILIMMVTLEKLQHQQIIRLLNLKMVLSL